VRALCAEAVDWRRAYAEADARAEEERRFLVQIQPEQYATAGRAAARAAEPAPGRQAGPRFPDWDLQPPLQVLPRRASPA